MLFEHLPKLDYSDPLYSGGDYKSDNDGLKAFIASFGKCFGSENSTRFIAIPLVLHAHARYKTPKGKIVIKEVEAQVGKKIDPVDAVILILKVEEIKAAIGCQ